MADLLAQVAEAVCRGAHPTRWEYRATSSPCPACTSGAVNVVAAGLVGETETEWGVMSLYQDWPDEGAPPRVVTCNDEAEARALRLHHGVERPVMRRSVTPWRAADDG